MATERAPVVAVIGAGRAEGELVAWAEAVGAGVARRGWTLVTGGRGGVMAAASRGAAGAGGLVVGILPGDDDAEANPWVAVPIATGLGDARNAVIARAAQVVVAVGGSHGTLSEMALALKMGKPVVGLGSWDIPGVRRAADPEEALRLAGEALTRRWR